MEDGKAQRRGRMDRMVVTPSVAANNSSAKYLGLSMAVTETEYLEQNGALSTLSLEPIPPFLFLLCLTFEAPK